MNVNMLKFYGWMSVGLSLLLGNVWAATTEHLIECKVELERGVLEADQQQTAVVKVSLLADAPPQDAERPPVNLCIVMDYSGSMQGNKMEQARQAALEALSRLGAQDIFSLVIYDTHVETLIPAGALKDQRRARELIQSIRPSGNTNLFGGVSQGASELRKAVGDHAEGMVHRMILLSDGLANVGPSSPGELGRLGTSLQKEGISVTTIGVGIDYNEDVMTSLSQRSDGNTYFVENENDLARIFNEELGDVLSVVARNVRIKINCPENVKPIRSIGRDATIRGQSVEVDFNQLYGSQERFLLLEVEVPATAADIELPLLSAAIQYRNLFSEQDETQSLALNAQFSKRADVVQASYNEAVGKDLLLTNNALAKEEAITLYEQGDQKAAVELLRRNQQLLIQGNEYFSVPQEEITAEVNNLELRSTQLEEEGLNTKNRKLLRTEAEQTKSQQRTKSSWFK
ncbi:VWA domain-containing protein [Kiritimatiellota bacterium B12222]|nr:VWA domain-containing protein [Kiritimatiellota bacterium B12222]